MVETTTEYTGKHRPLGTIFGDRQYLRPNQISVAGIQFKLFLEAWDATNSRRRQQTAGGAR